MSDEAVHNASVAGDSAARKLALPLLILRITLGLFLLQWGVEKLVKPNVAARIYEHFYFIEGLSVNLSFAAGVAECAVALGILFGLFRGISYLVGLVIHAGSTLATWQHIIAPFAEGSNHLFMTGVPVLAAFLLLYVMRDYDTRFSLDAMRKNG